MTIPGNVREQLKQWSNGRSATKPDDRPQRETLDARDLTVLGRLGRSSFARTKDGRELKVRGPVAHYRIEEAAADAILVRQLVRAPDGRSRVDSYLATAEEVGTYARLAARKTFTPKERPATPIDRDHELRRGEPRYPIQLVPDAKDDKVTTDIIMGRLSSRPSVIFTDGTPKPANVAHEIAMLQAAGITLALSEDRAYLLVTSAKGLPGESERMLNLRAPLYRAYLSGEPIRCAWPHPKKDERPAAVTIAVGGSPVCGAHLSGELQ